MLLLKYIFKRLEQCHPCIKYPPLLVELQLFTGWVLFVLQQRRSCHEWVSDANCLKGAPNCLWSVSCMNG